MAPTFRHGKGSYFAFTDTGGSTINASSGLSDISFSRDLGTAEVTAMGDDDRAYIPGLRGATISLSGHFASTYASKIDGMLGNSTATNWTYAPEGNTGGLREYTGEAHMTGLSYSGGVDGSVAMSFDLQITGAVTSGTV